MAKKINLNKSDTLKDIVDHIVNDLSEQIILVVPNFSRLAESPTNFKVLKKIAEATDKKITIESVDDRVVQLAKDVELEALNPFFSANRPKKWEDIEASLLVDEKLDDKKEDREEEELFKFPKKKKIFRLKKNHWVWLSALLFLTLPSGWLAFNVLPRAEIVIETKKAEWQFNDLISIEKGGPIVGQVFSQKKNAQMAFPATGKKLINKKAMGKIIVYNAYSSEPQKLVATTRFAISEGLVVRLAKDLEVPGAKIADSKISPSSIEAEVIADKEGPQYNIGPVVRLSVPGFKGTPRYDGFYGEIKEFLKGGAAGAVAYPTDADIKNGQAKVSQVLEDAINSQIIAQLPADFKLVDGSKKFSLLKSDANPDVNDKGEFSLFAEGEMTVIGFKEKDLLAFLREKMRGKLDNDYSFKTYNISYGIAKTDFKESKMSLPVDFKSLAEKPVNVDDLRRKIIGKSEIDLKGIIFSLPGLANASVTLWPFYVSSIPSNAGSEKVKITVK